MITISLSLEKVASGAWIVIRWGNVRKYWGRKFVLWWGKHIGCKQNKHLNLSKTDKYRKKQKKKKGKKNQHSNFVKTRIEVKQNCKFCENQNGIRVQIWESKFGFDAYLYWRKAQRAWGFWCLRETESVKNNYREIKCS